MGPFFRSFTSSVVRLRAIASPVEVLRIGCDELQHWSVAAPTTLVGENITTPSLVATTKLPAGACSPDALRSGALSMGLANLYSSPPSRKLVVVLESSWMPVMMAETDGVVVSESEAVALLRHRLAGVYDSHHDPVAKWDVRVQFDAGGDAAVGYGLSPLVRSALMDAKDKLGLVFHSVMPAWDWGWQRARRANLLPTSAGWWGWQEQNSWMLGRVSFQGTRPCISSLHPCLSWPSNLEELSNMVGAETRRLGLQHSLDNVRIGGWSSKTLPSTAQTEDLQFSFVSMVGHNRATTNAGARESMSTHSESSLQA